MKQLAPFLLFVAACGGSSTATSSPHSSSMALTADGKTLFVVNADADTISVIDTASRTLSHEIALGAAPSVDADGNFAPGVMPRTLALSADDKADLDELARRIGVAGDRYNEQHMGYVGR
jgi:YVTN family beta-propeller protein